VSCSARCGGGLSAGISWCPQSRGNDESPMVRCAFWPRPSRRRTDSPGWLWFKSWQAERPPREIHGTEVLDVETQRGERGLSLHMQSVQYIRLTCYCGSCAQRVCYSQYNARVLVDTLHRPLARPLSSCWRVDTRGSVTRHVFLHSIKQLSSNPIPSAGLKTGRLGHAVARVRASNTRCYREHARQLSCRLRCLQQIIKNLTLLHSCRLPWLRRLPSKHLLARRSTLYAITCVPESITCSCTLTIRRIRPYHACRAKGV